MTDQYSKNTGPFAAADSEAHQDPSTSSGSSPPDFFDLLARAGMPTDDGHAALSLKFLRGGQTDLNDEAFLVIYEAARATHASDPIYPGSQAKLALNAGLSPKNATRVVARLVAAGLVEKTVDGQLDFAPFWVKYPVGKNASGKGAAFLKAPAWLLFNRKALSWTPRDLRVLLLLGSFYSPANTAPRLGGAEAGDYLGVAKSQAAEDLRGLSDRAKLNPGYPVGSRTSRGYEFSGLCRFISTHAHEILGIQGPDLGPPPAAAIQGSTALDDFFGTPGEPSSATITGGPTRKSGPKGKTIGVAPDHVHQALADYIKKGITQLGEGQQVRALGIARAALSNKPLSPDQELSLYRDAARIAVIGWAPDADAQQLRQALIKELRLWKLDPTTIAVISDTEFGYRISKAEVQDLAMRCSSRDELRAALTAKGLTPVPKP